MNLGGCDEDMYPRTIGILQRLPGAVDVKLPSPTEAGDDRTAFQILGDRLHRLEIVIGGDRKTRLDHIDLETRQLSGHLKLLPGIHAATRRLLTVSERGIKDDDSLAHCTYGPPFPPTACSNGSGRRRWIGGSRRITPNRAYREKNKKATRLGADATIRTTSVRPNRSANGCRFLISIPFRLRYRRRLAIRND